MVTEFVGNVGEALNHARILLKKGDFPLALEQIEELEKRCPDDVRVLFLKGVIQRRLGEHSEARSLLERVLQQAPDLDTTDKDTVWRANLQYSFSDDVMVYGTYAEGYRPGGLNRVFNTPIGGTYEPDFVTSYELGVKTTLMDGRLRLNAAGYLQTWDDFQLSRFDLSVSVLTLTDDVGTAESNGIEGDFTFLISDNWSLSGAASFNNAEITEDYWINRDNEGITEADAEKGLPLPRTPNTKWNVATRYNWMMGNMPSFIQASYVYTGESWNQLFSQANDIRTRKLQESYQIVNLSFGLERESWATELFVRNVFDERGAVFINGGSRDSRVTANLPRTIGLRFRQKFD